MRYKGKVDCPRTEASYLIFIGYVVNPTYAKTGMRIVQWFSNFAVSQLRFTGDVIDLGLLDMTVAEPRAMGVKTSVIGAALVGDTIEQRRAHGDD